MNMNGIRIKTDDELARCREAGKKAAEVLRIMCDAVKPGVTTKWLDDVALQTMHSLGCTSADFGYCGYPAQTCISVNEAVVHGVPKDTIVISDGDVVSIDITVAYNGFIGDNARTVICGGVDKAVPEIVALVENTEKALAAGIAAAKAGNRVGDISHAVEVIAKRFKLGIVREYVGHGCGVKMHEEPEIPNYGTSGRGPLLRPNMVICIEPMLTLGARHIDLLDDGWTVVTHDGKAAAHCEQMIAITDGAPEILTPRL